MTENKHYYLIGREVGGFVECPDISYEQLDIVESNTPINALKKYRKKHYCKQFSGIILDIDFKNKEDKQLSKLYDQYRDQQYDIKAINESKKNINVDVIMADFMNYHVE